MLADTAVNAKELFAPFKPDICGIMAEASKMILQEPEDPDKWGYLVLFKERTAQFYEGMIQGQLDAGNAKGIIEYIPGIVQFVLAASHDRFSPSQSLHITCIGIIGDLANGYRSQIRELLMVPQVMTYLSIHKASNNVRIREVANWAFNLVNSL